MKIRMSLAGLAGAMTAVSFAAMADTTMTINDTADSFLDANNPTLNYGKAGTMALAVAGSVKGEIDSIMKFNTVAIVGQFNSLYGVGGWQITGLTLSLESNIGGAGEPPPNGLFPTIHSGDFGIDWLSNDSWVEGMGGGMGAANGAVSFNSIAGLLASPYDALGSAFLYTPPGDNVRVSYALPLDGGLVNDAAAGGDVSLYLYAADNQIGYLFNQKDFNSNIPQLTLTVAAMPEPATLTLLGAAAGGWLAARRRKT